MRNVNSSLTERTNDEIDHINNKINEREKSAYKSEPSGLMYETHPEDEVLQIQNEIEDTNLRTENKISPVQKPPKVKTENESTKQANTDLTNGDEHSNTSNRVRRSAWEESRTEDDNRWERAAISRHATDNQIHRSRSRNNKGGCKLRL